MYNIVIFVYWSSRYESTSRKKRRSITEQRVHRSTCQVQLTDNREPDIRAHCKLNIKQMGMNCDRLESGVWEYLEQV